MIDQTVSHYKILEKLGEGGMGIVYKAQDTKLDRMVALKFLPPHLSASEQDKARFVQEAKAAAGLNHPNICTIHTIEEAATDQFIVMEYVEGQTLRGFKTDGLKLETILSYAIQIAEGLQAAHGKGIVHRDIKADNIMVNSTGQVKVMDFGLAKLKGSLKLTKASSTVGTLGYMAPEHIQGGEADARSDIFSFGVVLFELLSGQLPFRGEHEAAIMYSIFHEDPASLQKHRPDLSPNVEALIAKALEKNPDDRYQTVAELLVDLRRVQRKTSTVSRAQLAQVKDHDFEKAVADVGIRTTNVALGRKSKRTVLYASIGLALLATLAVGYFRYVKQEEPLTSLAVMPFMNATGNQGLEYLTDGITESIIYNLSRLSNLRVMSRTSVFRYKGKEIDPQEVGKTLGVQAVLTGRMTQRPNRFSISLELVDSRDNRQIWGDNYTRSLSDISTLETEIPKEVSKRLQVSLGGEEEQHLTKSSTSNTEAYQLYLKGRYNWNMRSPESLLRAIDFYSQALEQDPMYVQAYTGLAETYVIMPVYFFPPPKEVFEKTKYYALKALAINPKHAEALSALAHAKWGVMEFDEAEKDYKRAIELNPNYATAHQWYSLFLSTAGRHREASAEIKKAQELDPLSLIIQMNVGLVLDSEGRYNEAAAQYQKVIDVEPNFLLTRRSLGGTYLKMGKTTEALSEYEKVAIIFGGHNSPYLASTYAVMGKREQAQKILAELELLSKKGDRVEGAIALVYIALGEKKKVLEWLNKLYESRFMNIAYLWDLRGFPKLTGLDSDPEIQAALKKIGVQ